MGEFTRVGAARHSFSGAWPILVAQASRLGITGGTPVPRLERSRPASDTYFAAGMGKVNSSAVVARQLAVMEMN